MAGHVAGSGHACVPSFFPPVRILRRAKTAPYPTETVLSSQIKHVLGTNAAPNGAAFRLHSLNLTAQSRFCSQGGRFPGTPAAEISPAESHTEREVFSSSIN